MSSRSKYDKGFDNRVLVVLHLYKHDVPAVGRVNKLGSEKEKGEGFTIRSPKQARQFIKDNEELIKMIINYEDFNYNLTQEEKQEAEGMRQDLKEILKKMTVESFSGSGFVLGDFGENERSETEDKEEAEGFDVETFKKNFYNAPINEFKKMLDEH